MVISLYAALCGVMLVVLSVTVIRQRGRDKVALGDGKSQKLQQCIRAQGNFVEYAPLFLIMLALAEMQNLSHYAVHGIALLFVAGRILHAYSLVCVETYDNDTLTGHLRFRMAGMVMTFLGLIAATIALISVSSAAWF